MTAVKLFLLMWKSHKFLMLDGKTSFLIIGKWNCALFYVTGRPLLLLLSRFSCVQLCATPLTAAHQAPPSLGFSRQEHWHGLPFPSAMHDCPTLCDPLDSRSPGSFVYGILQTVIFSMACMPCPPLGESSWPRDWTWISCISCIARWGSLPLAPPGKPWNCLCLN